MGNSWNPLERERDEGRGGTIGKIWRSHGGGYYALLAVGTFVYLEIQSLADSFGASDGVRDFVESEIVETLITFGLETLLNSFFAGIWPIMWVDRFGLAQTALFAGGGYVVWAVLLAWLLARREKAYRKELGL